MAVETTAHALKWPGSVYNKENKYICLWRGTKIFGFTNIFVTGAE